MKAGAVISIPDHISGAKGQSIRQPGLAGRWSIWSKSSGGPGWHFAVPLDDTARATGIKHATVRVTFAQDAAHPTVQLVGCDPQSAMPATVKHQPSQENR